MLASQAAARGTVFGRGMAGFGAELDRLADMHFKIADSAPVMVARTGSNLRAAVRRTTGADHRGKQAVAAALNRHGGSGGAVSSGGGARRSTPARKPNVARPTVPPAPDDIHHNAESLARILRGEGGRYGGHLAGTSRPGATEFPPSWGEDAVTANTLALARTTNPTGDVYVTRDAEGHLLWAWRYRGTVDGVELEAVVQQNGLIRAAYPLRGPGVVVNPPSGSNEFVAQARDFVGRATDEDIDRLWTDLGVGEWAMFEDDAHGLTEEILQIHYEFATEEPGSGMSAVLDGDDDAMIARAAAVPHVTELLRCRRTSLTEATWLYVAVTVPDAHLPHVRLALRPDPDAPVEPVAPGETLPPHHHAALTAARRIWQRT